MSAASKRAPNRTESRVEQSVEVLIHKIIRSLTADPSCEEMVQLEAFRRVHVQLQLNYSPSDISRAGSDEDDEETASSDSSVQLWRRARRNPAAGWHQ